MTGDGLREFNIAPQRGLYGHQNAPVWRGGAATGKARGTVSAAPCKSQLLLAFPGRWAWARARAAPLHLQG